MAANSRIRDADIAEETSELTKAQILQQAGISSADDPCVWSKPSSPSARPTVLVQLGDLVDRGVESLECLRCLESLQKTVPAGSKVVRLIGNHDIWWMEGNFDYTEE